MDYSKHSDKVIVFDPLKLRPGTICNMEVIYSVKYETTWDSSRGEDFIYTFPGFVSLDSVKAENYNIPAISIEITENDGNYKVVINPVYQGEINLIIFYYMKTTQTIIAKSAFSSTYDTYYKDYVEKDSVIMPKAVLELQNISEAYKIEKVRILSQVMNNGITCINGPLAKINSSGLLEYNNEYFYILKKGKEYAKIPLDSDLPATKVEGNKKIVEIDNQEWQNGHNEARGMLSYDDKVFILTNKSLCIFNIYSNFETPILEDENIKGYDLTYLPDDCILVSNGNKLYKYKIRHNNVLISLEDGRIYMREKDSCITIANA